VTAIDRTDCPARPDRIHGTTWAYKHWGCRCSDGVAAMHAVWAGRRAAGLPRSTARRDIAHSRTWDYDELSVEIALDRVRRHVGAPPLLSSAERRAVVGRLTAEGWTAGRIGAALGLSQRGVQRHRYRLREATAASRAAA
jgi:DNA-binding NarL/FixJ family response regulator